jgi:hypothetical protein
LSERPRIDLPERCKGGTCVATKIDEYARRLKDGSYDKSGASGDLAFLIHFVADIHQPLHTANDADLGGNCVIADSQPRAKNLHNAWDTTIVRRLEESIDSGRPETTARRLEQTYGAEKATYAWIPGGAYDIAWESTQIARSDIFAALKLPVEPCDPPAALCSNEPEVTLSPAYMDQAEAVAGHQLVKAGFRLASLLNGIWTQPIADGRNTVMPGAASGEGASLPQKAMTGPIVGNLWSKIYAWPGCSSYDTMAAHNRVAFSNRDSAEQAGYRAALNCPR